MTDQYKAGDRVWVVFDRPTHHPSYFTIAKTGRKWVHLCAGRSWRFAVGSTDLEEPGFGRIGRVFQSEEQWKAIVDLNKKRSVILERLEVRYGSPLMKLSLEQLEAIDRIVSEVPGLDTNV